MREQELSNGGKKIEKFGTKKILVMIGIGMLALVFWEIYEATGTEIFGSVALFLSVPLIILGVFSLPGEARRR